jgi:hypothetical protein
MRNSNHLKTTLPQPNRPEKLPNEAQWLSGEGAGSWFYIVSTSYENRFEIIRYHPTGKLECQGIFKLDSSSVLNLNVTYQFQHISHCAFVHILQNRKLLKLIRINEDKSELQNR